MQKAGKLIVIEGTDGSGKATQCEMLCARLRNIGVSVTPVDFPTYGKPQAWFAEQYLKGSFGAADALDPKLISIFYALDRLHKAPDLMRDLERGNIVIANRYTPSNMGHQGAKLSDPVEREKLIRWVYDFEYNLCRIPKPDLNIFLRVPVEISFELVKKRNQQKVSAGDILENDLNHLRQAAESYDQVCQMYVDEFTVIECVVDGKLLRKEQIHEEVILALVDHGR